MLIDRHKRVHDYLRISLTDSCNLRCSYCMPEENISCMPQSHLMQPDEIEAIAGKFVELGVTKIRLTGGEPLVRKGVDEIIRKLSGFPVELTMTTNAVYVDKYLGVFKEAGLRSLNVSLDTLKKEKFIAMTRRDRFEVTWNNIMLLLKEGFRVKLNVVAMKGVNDDEVLDFIALTQSYPLHVRFIEFMPFSGNKWEHAKVVKAEDMLRQAADRFEIVKLVDKPHATAKKHQVLGAKGTFAFITTMSEPFCSGCNRMRLTADGKMKNCLFGKDEMDILGAFRRGEDIVPIIQKSLFIKHAVMGGQFDKSYEYTDGSQIENRSMIKIGG